MKLKSFFFLMCGLGLGVAGVQGTSAQTAQGTAVRKLQTSAFGLFSGTWTGLRPRDSSGTLFGQQGRNVSITAGADVSVYSFSRYAAAVEVRGTFPVSSGQVAGERSVMGGVRISREPAGIFSTSPEGFGRLRPYGDFLFGRGQMNYQNGGYLVITPAANLLYKQTAGNVYGGGGGVEVDLSPKFSLKIDYQAQHWHTPVVPSGSVWSQQVGAGIVYRIGASNGPS